MTISDKISDDLIIATKQKNTEKIQAIRLIIAQYQTLDKKKDNITETDIIKIIKKLINGEKTQLLFKDKIITDNQITKLNGEKIDLLIEKKLKDHYNELTSEYINIWEQYLPKQSSDDDVIDWIKNNIDKTKYNEKSILKFMKDLTKIFPSNDSNGLKNILLSYIKEE